MIFKNLLQQKRIKLSITAYQAIDKGKAEPLSKIVGKKKLIYDKKENPDFNYGDSHCRS